jgi:hypothetical protein
VITYFKNLFAHIWEQIVTKFNPVLEHSKQSSTPQNALTQLILSVNAPYRALYPPEIGPTINAEIHTISASAAMNVANLIIESAAEQNIDYIYLAACIFQESKFDEACFNHNLAEYNGVVSFEGTDWGISQNSGYYLSSKPGMPTYPVKPPQPHQPVNPTKAQAAQYKSDMAAYETALTNFQNAVYHWENEASALARTAEWAIPVMAQVMHDNLVTAQNDLPSVQDIMDKLNTTSLSHEQFLATLFYNRGETGGLEAVKTLSYSNMQHPFMVGRWYKQFKAALQQTKALEPFVMLVHQPFAPHVKR